MEDIAFAPLRRKNSRRLFIHSELVFPTLAAKEGEILQERSCWMTSVGQKSPILFSITRRLMACRSCPGSFHPGQSFSVFLTMVLPQSRHKRRSLCLIAHVNTPRTCLSWACDHKVISQTSGFGEVTAYWKFFRGNHRDLARCPKESCPHLMPEYGRYQCNHLQGALRCMQTSHKICDDFPSWLSPLCFVVQLTYKILELNDTWVVKCRKIQTIWAPLNTFWNM